MAKSIADGRLMDLPISPLMWDLVLGKKVNLFDLQRLDMSLFNLFSDLQVMANRKKEIDESTTLGSEEKAKLISEIRTSSGAKLEDCDLAFYLPNGGNDIELLKDGKDLAVTMDNL